MWHFGKHTRRGLTSVVTGAIMLTAVAVMGSGVVSWANGSFFTHKEILEETHSDNLNKIQEYLVIENVWFGTNPQKFVNITFANVGEIGVDVKRIELINSTQNIGYQQNNLEVFPKKSNSIVVQYEWKDGIPIDVVFTTTRDSIFKTQALP
jgi:archaellum component FlaF (FlaF/FlaG flagellin family)